MTHLVVGLGFLVSLMLQMGVVSRLTLLSGAADLILLFVAAWALQDRFRYAWLWTIIIGIIIGQISAMPILMPLLTYGMVTTLATLLKSRVWQSPVLAMFFVTFFGTLIQHILYILWLQLSGVSLSWSEGLNFIALPSLLLNMMLVLPVHAFVQDLAIRVNPTGLEV